MKQMKNHYQANEYWEDYRLRCENTVSFKWEILMKHIKEVRKNNGNSKK